MQAESGQTHLVVKDLPGTILLEKLIRTAGVIRVCDRGSSRCNLRCVSMTPRGSPEHAIPDSPSIFFDGSL